MLVDPLLNLVPVESETRKGRIEKRNAGLNTKISQNVLGIIQNA